MYFKSIGTEITLNYYPQKGDISVPVCGTGSGKILVHSKAVALHVGLCLAKQMIFSSVETLGSLVGLGVG